jgi:hypothetical protein
VERSPLVNRLSETRVFDARYFPYRIQAGALLDWDYGMLEVRPEDAEWLSDLAMSPSPEDSEDDVVQLRARGEQVPALDGPAGDVDKADVSITQ